MFVRGWNEHCIAGEVTGCRNTILIYRIQLCTSEHTLPSDCAENNFRYKLFATSNNKPQEHSLNMLICRLRLKCDGTRTETRFRLSVKRMSPFKSAGASVQSTTGSRGVRISGSNAGYTMFRDSVKSTGYPLHSPVSPSLPLLCVTVCHHISTGLCLPSPIHPEGQPCENMT